MILEENRTASYIRSLYTGNTELLDTIERLLDFQHCSCANMHHLTAM